MGASSNIDLWRANIKLPVELVADDLELIMKTKRKRIVYGGVTTIVCLCGIVTKDLTYGVFLPDCVVLGKKIIYHDK